MASGHDAGVASGAVRVAAGGEVLEITELQAPGKKRMKAADYLNGHGITLPARFEG